MQTFETEEDKYKLALEKYNTSLDDERIKRETEQLLIDHLKENNREDVKRFLLNCLDLTSLNTTDTEEEILKLTEKVNRFVDEFADFENVASICVYPSMVQIVNDTLEADEVKIAAVSGGFPHSQTFIEVKIAETALCLQEGANEIDCVMPVGKFLNEDYEGMCDEIEEIKFACKDNHLKVILETGALMTASNIKKASILSMYSGADFIKTSTGKQHAPATPEAAYVMCQSIKEYHELTGRKIGFKAAGGIKNVNDALVYYTIVKEMLGQEWLTNELFRIGSSSLANQLLSELTGKKVNFFN